MFFFVNPEALNRHKLKTYIKEKNFSRLKYIEKSGTKNYCKFADKTICQLK